MRRLKLTLFALVSLLLCSCSAYKKVPYLQGSEYLDMANVKTPLYDAHIMPKDLLTITVNTSDPDAAIPFNLTVATPITANSKNLTSQPSLQQYLVDNNGNIDFPVLGTLHIGGITYGHQWLLSTFWSLEASISVGYAHLTYDKYGPAKGDALIKKSHSNYVGPTQLGISFIYFIQ